MPLLRLPIPAVKSCLICFRFLELQKSNFSVEVRLPSLWSDHWWKNFAASQWPRKNRFNYKRNMRIYWVWNNMNLWLERITATNLKRKRKKENYSLRVVCNDGLNKWLQARLWIRMFWSDPDPVFKKWSDPAPDFFVGSKFGFQNLSDSDPDFKIRSDPDQVWTLRFKISLTNRLQYLKNRTYNTVWLYQLYFL